MKTVNYNDTQTETYSNQVVRGVDFNFTMVANTNNTTLQPTDFQFRNTTVSVKLVGRKSEPIDIISTTYDVILAIACYNCNPVRAAWKNNQMTASNMLPSALGAFLEEDSILQLASSTTKDMRNICCTLEFPNVIELEGEEYLQISMQYGAATLVEGGNASPTGSSAQFGVVNGHGHEHGVPKYRINAMQQSQAQSSVPCGTDTEEIFLISMDRLDIQTANQVAQNYSMSGTGGGQNILFTEMCAHRAAECGAFWDSMHLQDFRLYKRKSDHVAGSKNITINFNVTNVTAGNNYVVAVGFDRTKDDTAKYLAKTALSDATRNYKAGHMSHSDFTKVSAHFAKHLE